MRFHVTFPNGESLNVHLTSNQLKGSSLLQTVFEHLNISNDITKYFGLSYSDKYDGGKNWIQTDDNLKKINGVKSANSIPLQLELQILPKDPHVVFTSLNSLRMVRDYLKNLLVRDLMRCENIECAAVLDAFIAQSELGNFDNVKENYAKHMNALDIYLPTYILTNVDYIDNREYLKKVQGYHIMLKDMSPVESNAMFLSKAQNMPYYGYSFHTITDAIRKQYLLALSPYGIHFIYDTSVGVEVAMEKQETFEWNRFIACTQLNQRQFKLKLFVTANTVTARKFKIKSQKDVIRFIWDMNKYRQMVVCSEETTFPRSLGSKNASREKEEENLHLIPIYGSCI